MARIQGKQLTNPIILSGSFSGSFQGAGSITSASFATNALTASFAISASHEIIKEVSSSHANFADLAGGLSGIPSIVVNQITASGDISASSATITALTGSFNHIITDDDTIEFRNKSTGVQTGRLKFDASTGLNVQDNTGARTKIRAGRGEFLSLEAGPVGFNSLGSITASVNISASGDIVANNLSGTNTGDQDLSNLVTNSSTASFAITGSDVIFGDITTTGDIKVKNLLGVENIVLKNTSLDLLGNENQLRIGSGGTITEIEIGRSTSSNRKIEIYGQITASGAISASGDIVGNNLSGTNTGDQDLSNLVTNAQTASFAITSSNVIFGNITSSGNISASNTVFGVTGSFNQISSNPANVKTNITMGGTTIDIGNTSTPASLGGSSFPLTTLAGPTTFQGMVSAANFLVGSGSTAFMLGGIPTTSILRIGGVTSGLFGSTYTVGVDITGNITASGNISGSSTSTLTIGGAANVGREGILGSYLNGGGQVQGVWSIGVTQGGGTVYKIDTSADDFGNAFGLGYAYNGNGGSVTGFNHQFVLVNNGTVNGALSFEGHASLNHITASGDISASGDIFGVTGSFSHLVGNSPLTVGDPVSFQQPITASIISSSGQIIGAVVDNSFETFLNFEAATAFTFIAPFPLTINFTGSSTSSMDVAGFVTASANTSTFSVQQTPPITLNIFDKLKITPSSSGLFSFSGSRTI